VLIAGGQKLVWDLPTSASIHEFSFKLNGQPARLSRTEKGFEAQFEDLPLGATVNFEMDLKLNGFAGVDFRIPAEKLKLSMASKWPHPSFGGQLPIKLNITADGFTATWSLMQSQNNQSISIGHVSPVNIYSQTERALKYSSLIILLLLTSLFLMETLWKLRLHGLHYLLMTLPLSAFYILVLALSEHLGFAMSYVAGCTAVLALLLIYFKGIGAKPRQTSVLATILIAIDALVYTMLSSEDFALLIGAISLFLALSAFMLMTMRVNWTRTFSATPNDVEADPQAIPGTSSASLRSEV
jgi:inner membrane protein